MTEAKFDFEGEHHGVQLGPRPSGVTLATAGGKPVHVFLPDEWRFAPALAKLTGVRPAGDRLRIDPTMVDVERAVAEIEAVIASGKRGGIQAHAVGPYTVEVCPDAWAYRVTTTPAGRPSLKRIGVWTGEAGVFDVPFERESELATLLGRAADAVTKTETTTVRLPEIPGLVISAADGEIRVSGGMSDKAVAAIRHQRGLRWDRSKKAWVVSARYAKSMAKTLARVLEIVSDEMETTRLLDEAKSESARQEQEERRQRISALMQSLKENPIESDQIEILLVADLPEAPYPSGYLASEKPQFAPRPLGGSIAVRCGYNAQIVDEIKYLAGAQWDKGNRVWRLSALAIPDLREAIQRWDGLLKAAAEAEAKQREARAAEARKAAQSRAIYPISIAPPVGDEIVWRGVPRRVAAHGRRQYVEDDGPSIYGSMWLGHEGSWGVWVEFRDETHDEASEREARENLERQKNAKARRRREIVDLIVSQGDQPEGVSTPVGDLVGGGPDAYGGGQWFVLDAGAAIWFVRNNGMDGDDWSRNNVATAGAGAVGWRIPWDEDLAAEIREVS